MFTRLNQTLEGLFKVASSSLSFATLLHDSYVSNFKILRRRRDVVFSQVVSDNATCTCCNCCLFVLSTAIKNLNVHITTL